ncbi:MAG: tetratricopeptide repeat protein [Tepidisphaeraceae bacterium]
MTRRRKSAKRLGILAAAVASVGLAVGYSFHHKQMLHEADLQHDRAAGLAAYVSGDYPTAIEKLDTYLAEHDDDDAATLAFAVARSKVDNGGGQNLRRAIEKLDQLLLRHPNDLAAEHALLEILPQTGDTDRLAAMSDDVLSRDPHDTVALAARITVCMRQNHLEAALAAAHQYADLKPDDLQARITVLHLLTRLQKPAADVRAYADAQFTKKPDDPRRLLLRAIATSYDGDAAGAIQLLQQAAARPLEDAAFIQQLANLFDLLHQFDASRSLLESAADRTRDPVLIDALIVRLWQQGRFDDIATRLASLNATDTKTEPKLAAFRAIALFETHHPAAANGVVDALKKRDDRQSLAWAGALAARYGDDHFSVEDADSLNKALSRDPDNGVFKAWLAECYSSLGESALALRAWSGASLQMPEWSTPFVGMTQALLQLDRTSEAVQAAQSAFDRRPTSLTAINLAEARYSDLPSHAEPAKLQELLQWIERVQAIAPNDTTTLPMQVDLLTRLGQTDRAKDLLRQAATHSPAYGDATLLSLARISRAHDLGMEDALLSAIPTDQASPTALLTRASLLADAGKIDQGRSLLQNRADHAPADQKAAWDLSIARYLEAVHDPRAADAWRKLADAHPDSLDIQRSLLEYAQSARADRELIDRTIKRLRALTGEQGQQWKIERARWLIESPDVMKDCVEAVTLLSDVVRESPRQIGPRLELARALERTGNTNSAIEHLKLAQAIDPADVTTAVELVRLYQQNGRSDAVRDTLQRLTESADLTPAERVRVASLFLDAGDPARAIDLLTAVDAPLLRSSPARLLLAAAYRQANQPDKAAAEYTALLAQPDPSPAALASAAEFYARQQQPDRARALLDQLNHSSATPLEIALANARFEERFGDRSAALKQYRRAADTHTEAGYLALVDFDIRSHDMDGAYATVQQAKADLPQSRVIADRALEVKALSLTQKNPQNLRPLIEVLSQDPSRAAETETLRTLAAAHDGVISQAELLPELRAVADRYPTYLPLQEQLINAYLKLNRGDDAVLIARRLMDALPTDPSVARLATNALQATGRWNEARLAAEQWRARAGGDTLDPDTAIAEALVELKRPADALARLQPYHDAITADVRGQPQAAFVMARAMTLQGQDVAARTLLQPLLQDAAGRRMWRSIAQKDAPTLANATAFCRALEAALPADAWEERSALLSLWAAVGRRFDDTPTLTATVARINSYLVTRPRDIDVLVLLSGLYQQLGQLSDAETTMRSVLATDPQQPAVSNDLACLLMTQNHDPEQALRLAQTAVHAAPTVAAYQDTLARALMGKKQFAEARQAFTTALRLDPNLVEARVGLARLLNTQGDAAGARTELRRAESQLQAHPQAGRDVQGELSSLRASLAPNDP